MKYIVTVRGRLAGDPQEARKVHDATVDKVSPVGRSMGSTAHTAYLNTQDPRGFLAVDEWNNLEAIQKLYGDPTTAAELGRMFDGMPEVTVWAESGWRAYRDKE